MVRRIAASADLMRGDGISFLVLGPKFRKAKNAVDLIVFHMAQDNAAHNRVAQHNSDARRQP